MLHTKYQGSRTRRFVHIFPIYAYVKHVTPGAGVIFGPRHISFCGRVPWLYQYWPGGFCFLWLYVQELPKAQPAVVLVLKHLRRQGNGLKSHPTDWEKPGIEPATPGLQDISLSPTPQRLLNIYNLNKLGRGPLGDATYQISEKKILKFFI